MATSLARVKVYSTAIPVSVWGGGLALLAILVALLWALPEARLLVSAGLAFGALLAAVLLVLRVRSRSDGSPAAPLHLRD